MATDLTRPTGTVPVPLAAVAATAGVRAVPAAQVRVTGVTLSSRGVRPGDLYVAPAGSRAHGASYAAEAVAAGAVAVLTDTEGARILAASERLDVPVLVVDRPRSVVGALAAQVYGEPAGRLTLVAVTGTQGKTTTTRMLEAALGAAGVPSAVIGTVGTRIRGVDVKTALTTPEAPDLHALFAVMVEQGVRVCAMEVSSHALVMGRVDGVVFDVAAFLNLGRDHLDFHESVEDYFAAKASLFTPERARLGITNIDDEHGRQLLARAGIPMRTFGLRSEADWWADEIDAGPAGSDFTLHDPAGAGYSATVPLAGAFNVANAVAGLAAAGEAGLDVAALAAALGGIGGVPGRLERVPAELGFAVYVDYAHKPDAVEAAIQALRPVTAGRLITVLGAGGDRDRGKRPLMGEIAARLSDVLLVTDDNPRSEDPATIRAEVLAGTSGRRAEVREAGGRREAIEEAVALARDGDTVLIAGKGHETGQEVAGVVHPFDDRVVAAEALARRSGG